MTQIKKFLSAATAAIVLFGTMTTACFQTIAMDIANPIESDCYTGNMGDSFIDVIGTRNGNTTVNGVIYDTGIEFWIARYNYKDEQSWAWATYEVDPSETEFKGTLSVLKDSYNTKNYNTTLTIYVDDEAVYSYTMTPGFEPQNIDIPLSGASEIKFSVYDNEAHSGGTSFCIGTGTGYMIGDVDNNGYINAIDASMVLSAYAQQATGQPMELSDLQKKVADVDKDEKIDAIDASWILSYYAYTATGGSELFEDFMEG